MVFKEAKEDAINGEQEDNVREETSAVSGTMKISVQNRQQKPFHFLNHQHQEVEVCREEGPSEAKVQDQSTAVQRRLEKHQKNHVTVGIFPNASFKSENRDVNSAKICAFPHWKVDEQQNKKPKKGGDKSAVAIVKSV